MGNDGASRVGYVQAMANRNARSGNYANWRPVASADFDQNYEPISPTYPGPVAYTYTVKAGDTLQSIALTVWGDADMWYLIADANGIVSGQQLEPNMELIIPNKVTNIHNNASTYRPYNPGEAIGDLNPTIPATPQPKPKKKGCGAFGSILAAIVTVVVTVITKNPALGNLAGQAVGIATGAQKGFNFTSFATSVVIPQSGFAPVNTGSQIFNAAANAAITNVASQGIGIITGEQKGFSWSSVAASAVGGAVGRGIGNKLGVNKVSTDTFAYRNPVATSVITSAVGNTASELTRVAIDGGRINWTGVATGAVQAGVGNLTRKVIAQRDQLGNTNNVKADDPRLKLRPDGKSPFTGERINVADSVRISSAGIEDDLQALRNQQEELRRSQYITEGYEVESLLLSGAKNGGLTASNSAPGVLTYAIEEPNIVVTDNMASNNDEIAKVATAINDSQSDWC